MRLPHLLPAALLLSLPLIARADTTYTYTGNPFNYFDGNVYKPGDYLRGTITFGDATSPGAYPGTISLDQVLSCNFTDGEFTYTLADDDGESGFAFYVDPQGNVEHWFLFMDSYFPGLGGYTAVTTNYASPYPSFFADDFGQIRYDNPVPPLYESTGEIDNDPGVWSGPMTSTPTPEPSTLALLGTGVLGIVSLRIRTRNIVG